jgi:hypothetical protein
VPSCSFRASAGSTGRVTSLRPLEARRSRPLALGRGGPSGRRAAAVLSLIAFIRPLTPVYAGDSPCEGGLPLFSLDWFKTVACAWGPYELALLAAALLVLLATHAFGPTEEPAITAPSRPAWHRGLTLLIDYLVVATLVTLAVRVAGGWSIEVTGGLLQWLSFDQVLGDPARLLFYPALVLYILVRWRFTRRLAASGDGG